MVRKHRIIKRYIQNSNYYDDGCDIFVPQYQDVKEGETPSDDKWTNYTGNSGISCCFYYENQCHAWLIQKIREESKIVERNNIQVVWSDEVDMEDEVERFYKIYNQGIENPYDAMKALFLATVDEKIRSAVDEGIDKARDEKKSDRK